jgi:hypothetical protein
MRKPLAFLCFAVLTTSCSGGTSITPTNAPVPTSATIQSVVKAGSVKSKAVTITEVPLPTTDMAPLAVAADGSVYLGSLHSLYRYANGAFTSTLPYEPLNPNCFLPSYTKPCGSYVEAIAAVGLPQVVWAAEYLQQGAAFSWAQLDYGGFEGAPTAPPGFTESTKLPPTSNIQSIVVHDKTIWLGGSTRALTQPFSHDVPYGRPAKLPSLYQQGDLILTNGPHHHVWGTIIHPPGGSPVFEFASDGSILHTFAAPYGAEVGDIVGDKTGLWFTDYDTNDNAIGHMTDKGVVTEIRLPTPDSVPFAIAESVDGSVWFTELEGGVGRLDPKRHLTEFNVRGDLIATNPDSPGCNPDVVYVLGPSNLVEITF